MDLNGKHVGKREEIAEEVDKGSSRKSMNERKEISSKSRLAEAAAGVRSTGPVDLPQ